VMQDRYCLCGKQLVRKPKESKFHFGKRKTCGVACNTRAREYKREICADKKCEYCHEIIKRDDYKQLWRFKKVKYCSVACSNMARAHDIPARMPKPAKPKAPKPRKKNIVITDTFKVSDFKPPTKPESIVLKPKKVYRRCACGNPANPGTGMCSTCFISQPAHKRSEYRREYAN
jgi:hypothetical protein